MMRLLALFTVVLPLILGQVQEAPYPACPFTYIGSVARLPEDIGLMVVVAGRETLVVGPLAESSGYDGRYGTLRVMIISRPEGLGYAVVLCTYLVTGPLRQAHVYPLPRWLPCMVDNPGVLVMGEKGGMGREVPFIGGDVIFR